MSRSKYRSRTIADNVIAFSVSYQRENMLARGMGLEHLRELLIRMARPILRHGASLAYGGHWKETEDNFTYTLLRLINAEQEDNSLGGPDSSLQIGGLYNHCAWPHYLSVTPKIEAQWINCCRVVRVTQEQAGIAPADIVPDSRAETMDPRARFNAAITLSAMRQLSMRDFMIDCPDTPKERIPPIISRVLLGGRVDSYSGFMPGIFEEALEALRNMRSVYILGGFGGAAGVLAEAILDRSGPRPDELTLQWHRHRNAPLVQLLDSQFALPSGFRSTPAQLDELFDFVDQARRFPADTLRTGLTDDETLQLLTTCDIAEAVRLVRRGLTQNQKLPPVAA